MWLSVFKIKQENNRIIFHFGVELSELNPFLLLQVVFDLFRVLLDFTVRLVWCVFLLLVQVLWCMRSCIWETGPDSRQ